MGDKAVLQNSQLCPGGCGSGPLFPGRSFPSRRPLGTWVELLPESPSASRAGVAAVVRGQGPFAFPLASVFSLSQLDPDGSLKLAFFFFKKKKGIIFFFL